MNQSTTTKEPQCNICGQYLSPDKINHLPALKGKPLIACPVCYKKLVMDQPWETKQYPSCFSDLQNTLSRDEIRIIQEYRKLPGWGTMTLTKADNSLKFIEKTDKIKI